MKAILVLDKIPKQCDDCWLANFERADCYCYCMVLQKPIDYDDPNYEEMNTEGGDWRWDKCPLKELPKRIDYTQDKKYLSKADKIFYDGHNLGWNECLNEIEGTED